MHVCSQPSILPPVPSHQASFKGQPVALDVQWSTVQQTHKQRLVASSTDYVGVVRQRVGELVHCSPSSLRLLCGGASLGAYVYVSIHVFVCVCVQAHACCCLANLNSFLIRIGLYVYPDDSFVGSPILSLLSPCALVTPKRDALPLH